MSELASPTLKSILRYPGGKARIAPWVVSHMPPHEVYIEPFFGAGSVLFAKARSRVEIANDLDERVVNLYRVLREQPDEIMRLVTLTPYSRVEFNGSDDPCGNSVEDARRFLVRCWMAHGGKLGGKTGWRQGWAGGSGHERGSSANVWSGIPDRLRSAVERLSGVMIDCRPALAVLADWQIRDALVYADPPYPLSTRSSDSSRFYRHEMSDDDHVALLEALNAHPGPVLLSGYRCALYDDRLTHWHRVDRPVRAYRQAERIESLWLNPVAAGARRQLALEGHG